MRRSGFSPPAARPAEYGRSTGGFIRSGGGMEPSGASSFASEDGTPPRYSSRTRPPRNSAGAPCARPEPVRAEDVDRFVHRRTPAERRTRIAPLPLQLDRHRDRSPGYPRRNPRPSLPTTRHGLRSRRFSEDRDAKLPPNRRFLRRSEALDHGVHLAGSHRSERSVRPLPFPARRAYPFARGRPRPSMKRGPTGPGVGSYW